MENKILKELYYLSKKAYKKNEIPVSAIIVKNNKIVAKAYNKKNIKCNAIYHAEVLCLQKAYRKLKRWNLSDCEMYISLEPCDFCKLLIEESRIKNVYFILSKGNVTNKYYNTKYEQMYCTDNFKFEFLIKNFFKNIRK